MNTFRTTLIAVAALTMVSCAAFAQVRVITPNSEHVYSTDPARPQQLPDDEALKLQNERAERARIAREREQADQAASSKSQSPNPLPDGWNPNNQPPPDGWRDR
jgi:hypothetical protein